jgi:uncharacterized RDD family membrane protein YckC
MTEEKQPKWISGFWRRIGALTIDTIILGIIGQSLGFFAEALLVEIGVWGRLVGFTIALVYFGILNSKIGNGQTLGKRLLKIKVVDLSGELISPLKSLIRYSVLAVPFSLNGAPFPDEIMFSFAKYILSLSVFGGLLSIIYLYIFNRITRQSLHDIFTGTYVVNMAIEKQSIGNVWKPHYILVSLFFIAALVVPYFTGNLAKQEPFSDLLKSRNQLMKNHVVQNASISYGKSTFSSANSGTTETKYVSAQVYLSKDETSNEELAKSLAISIVENYPDALAKDTINMNLIYGFDIGIASKWNSHGHRFNPANLLTSK